MKNIRVTLRTILAASLISGGIGALLILSTSSTAQAQGGTGLSFFITSAGSGNGANLGGLAGRRQASARRWRGGRRRQPHVARLPERHGGRRSAGRQREGPDRQRALVQRQGREGGRERRRPAQRQQQARQGELAHRKGRDGERPRRHAEHARHPHRIERRRDAGHGRRRHDLRQLDQHGDRGSARSAITTSRAAARTPTSWNSAHLSNGCSQPNLVGDRRRRLVLLLRRELTGILAAEDVSSPEVCTKQNSPEPQVPCGLSEFCF